MTSIPDVLLMLRFAVGYPSMAVGGFLLGIIAYGRMRHMSGRRNVYRALTSAAFALAWTGLFGMVGVIQYGKFFTPLPLPMATVSMMFSCGIIWVGISMASLTVIVLVEEFAQTRSKHARGNIRRSMR